jgi:hypothetical protein
MYLEGMVEEDVDYINLLQDEEMATLKLPVQWCSLTS